MQKNISIGSPSPAQTDLANERIGFKNSKSPAKTSSRRFPTTTNPLPTQPSYLPSTTTPIGVTPNPNRNPVRCRQTPTYKLFPRGGYTIITLKAVGSRTFWCRNSTLVRTLTGQISGASRAVVRSTDGLWNGRFMNRPKDGRPQFTITHKHTGKRRVVIAESSAVARRNAPNGEPLTWERRRVRNSFGGQKPIFWVVRSHTMSGNIPTACQGNIDKIVPYTALYQFIVC